MIQINPRLRKKKKGEPVYTGKISRQPETVSSASVCEALDSFCRTSTLTSEVEKLKQLWRI